MPIYETLVDPVLLRAMQDSFGGGGHASTVRVRLRRIMEAREVYTLEEFRGFVEDGTLEEIEGVGPRTLELAREILERAQGEQAGTEP